MTETNHAERRADDARETLADDWRATLAAAFAEEAARAAEVEQQRQDEQRELDRKQGAHLRTVLTLLLGSDPGELDTNAYWLPGSPVTLSLSTYRHGVRGHNPVPETDGLRFNAITEGIRFELWAMTEPPEEWYEYDAEANMWSTAVCKIQTDRYVSADDHDTVTKLRARLAEVITSVEREHNRNIAQLQHWQDEADFDPETVAGDTLTVEVCSETYQISSETDDMDIARHLSDGWQMFHTSTNTYDGRFHLVVVWWREVRS